MIDTMSLKKQSYLIIPNIKSECSTAKSSDCNPLFQQIICTCATVTNWFPDCKMRDEARKWYIWHIIQYKKCYKCIYGSIVCVTSMIRLKQLNTDVGTKSFQLRVVLNGRYIHSDDTYTQQFVTQTMT
jgi:hypothetical protein